jgi:hypothetical protein
VVLVRTRGDVQLAVAIKYLDETIEKRRAEHDELVRQLRWLEEQRRQLLAQAAGTA